MFVQNYFSFHIKLCLKPTYWEARKHFYFLHILLNDLSKVKKRRNKIFPNLEMSTAN